VLVDYIDGHEMHEEYLEVPEPPAMLSIASRAAGGTRIAVGTTVVEESWRRAALAPDRVSARTVPPAVLWTPPVGAEREG